MVIKVMVVDDHEVVRRGVITSLQAGLEDCEVVGEAGTLAEARLLAEKSTIDVAVLDVVLPDGDGLQLCRELLARDSGVGCVLLTSFPQREGMLSAALAGAAAYLAKGSTALDLVGTVRTVANGGRLLTREVVTSLLHELGAPSPGGPGLETLTPQESRVFELVGQGMSNREIGETLHLAERTVKNYVSRMLTKLGMERRTEAAVLSARLAERRAQERARRSGGEPVAPD